MGSHPGLERICEMAIQMEKEGIDFYTRASEQTSNALGKEMFLSFVKDEESHLRLLEDIFMGAGIETATARLREGTPRERLQSIFESAGKKIRERIAAGADEIEALKIGMEMETRGYELYKHAAQEAASEEERNLLNRLAGEENQHYTMLQNTHIYLERTGEWFIWEERGLLDGGEA